MKPKFGLQQEMDRREFLKITASATATISWASYLSPCLIRVASAQGRSTNFTLACISDTHLLARGERHRFALAATRAVEDINALSPPPDFVLFGGDLAQLGRRDELLLGRDILVKLKPKLYMMVGEHDWYLDLGEAWQELFGKPTYSFDHKGVHFVVLNSVLVEDYWSKPKMTPEERMKLWPNWIIPRAGPSWLGKPRGNGYRRT